MSTAEIETAASKPDVTASFEPPLIRYPGYHTTTDETVPPVLFHIDQGRAVQSLCVVLGANRCDFSMTDYAVIYRGDGA